MGNLILAVCAMIVAAKSAPSIRYGYGGKPYDGRTTGMTSEELDVLERTGLECYDGPRKTCEYPDFWIHFWTRTKCLYGNDEYRNVREMHRGGGGECWWLSWYWFWLWLALGVTTGLGVLGCCFAPLVDASSFKYCLGGTGIGAGICCPLISWGFMYCLYIQGEWCELCQEMYNRSIFKFLDNSIEHRESCLEKNHSTYDNIPNSTLYTCKNCKKPLKIWPVDKLTQSECTQCENKIINDGTNLHVCFTCAGKGEKEKGFHHICNRHTTEGNVLEVNFQTYTTSLGPSDQPQSSNRLHQHQFNTEASQESSVSVEPTNVLPPAHTSTLLPPDPPGNVLPPGWQVVTNPVTGAIYGLCDPSGEIRPFISNNMSVPPPYTEAVAYPPTQE